MPYCTFPFSLNADEYVGDHVKASPPRPVATCAAVKIVHGHLGLRVSEGKRTDLKQQAQRTIVLPLCPRHPFSHEVSTLLHQYLQELSHCNVYNQVSNVQSCCTPSLLGLANYNPFKGISSSWHLWQVFAGLFLVQHETRTASPWLCMMASSNGVTPLGFLPDTCAWNEGVPTRPTITTNL
eukprot:2745437-Amphidinium_carterae.2